MTDRQKADRGERMDELGRIVEVVEEWEEWGVGKPPNLRTVYGVEVCVEYEGGIACTVFGEGVSRGAARADALNVLLTSEPYGEVDDPSAAREASGG